MSVLTFAAEFGFSLVFDTPTGSEPSPVVPGSVLFPTRAQWTGVMYDGPAPTLSLHGATKTFATGDEALTGAQASGAVSGSPGVMFTRTPGQFSSGELDVIYSGYSPAVNMLCT